MSAIQLPLTAPHRNQQLFSDHYLNAILPRQPGWRALAEELAPVRAAVAAIYARYTPSGNEAQLEEEVVRPVLRALGHTFEVQPALATADGTKRPDYVFYRDEAALLANKNQTLTEERLRPAAFAVGDAKAWDRALDVAVKTKGADPLTNRNPAYQIAFYMLHGGTEWGVLTNGRLWRLYHRETAHRLDRYYEVDLPALLTADDPAAFLYFAAFFGRAAFEERQGAGVPGVAAVLRASAEYARGIGAGVKAQVYEALRHLAQGFLDYAPNDLAAKPAALRQIYDNALIVLYRLLFVLYAEARGLLPVRESAEYRDLYSLGAIAREVASRLDQRRALLPTSATLWPRLRELFGIINAGSPPLKVATFNGGLFDPARHPFLERYVVGDARLQAALDRLARVGGEFVDYRDLAERHLGTIYEGLLEFHLEALPPDAPERAQGWTVALLNDKGERKATGSYYTPDYIVKYIVDQTVGPVLRAAVAEKETDAAKIAAVLNVNVLDPAMGSGHFPVEATEYIARFLVDLAVTPAADGGDATAGEADLAYFKRRVAQNCIYGVDLNPLAVDLAKLSLWLVTAAKDRPLSFLDHHLRVGNALVGARIADLRVATPAPTAAQRRKARQARQAEAAAAAAGQASMLADDAFRRSLSIAVDAMWLIEGTAGNTIAEVKEQERIYTALRDDLNRKYGRLADLATATRLGVRIDPALWGPLADYATGRAIAGPAQFAAWLAETDALAAERRFFHWELEFPEVFFDRHGQPLGERAGFHAVVGNPPYVRQEELAPLKPYFAGEYPEVYHGVADLFVYFFAQGLRQLREGGRLSYISSNSWLRANYATPLRAHLRTATTVEQLIDLGDNRVFADAPDVYPAIHVVCKGQPADVHEAQVAVFTRGEGLGQFETKVAGKLVPASIHDQPDSGWQLGDDAGRKVFTKLMAGGRSLAEVVDERIYYGVKTGYNEAFIIDQATRDKLLRMDPNSAEIIKPIVRGEDLRPWYQENEGRWLIFSRKGIRIDAYPSVKAYLQQFRERLEPRPRDWAGTDSWTGRKPGPYRWYEIQDTVEYYAAFEQPKVFWPDISKFPRFSWDTSGTFVNDKGCIVVPPEPFVLGVLQSRTSWLCISQLCVPLGERAGSVRYQQKIQFIARLPIPDAPAAEREAIGALAMAITEQARARYDLHRKTRNRILTDLGAPGKGLNQKLTAWWTLDFPTFRAELQKVFKREIAVKERDDWDAWLAGRRAEHERYTAEIVRLETDLNARVYALFALTPAEIAIIEESTRYRYGEV